MKKIKSLIAIILVLLFCLTSCGEYIDPITSNNGTDTSTDTNVTDKPSAEGGTFSVVLKYNGERLIPKEDDIIVEWTKVDGHGVHTAPLDKDGVAKVDNLDGDYKITLSKVPDGYVYNPNGHIATNDNKEYELELFKPIEIKTSNKGSNFFEDCITIKRDGVYMVTLESENHIVYYQYTPTQIGTYCIESWADVEDNTVNPKLDAYHGTGPGPKYFDYTVNDGGEESYYTKNFKYGAEITSLGQGIFFAVKANSKNGVYPLTLTFTIYRDGDVPGSGNSSNLTLPMDELVHQSEYSKDKYTITPPETIKNGARVFDENMWKLWSKDDGGDGYYHLYDIEAYPETNGYGPILYAYIDTSSRFLSAITDIEAAGNNALTIYYTEDGGVRKVNYKMAFEGFPKLVIDQTVLNPNFSAPYMCVNNCPCYVNKTSLCYENEGIAYIGACPEQCEQCSKDCRHISDDAFNLLVEASKPNSNITTVTTCRYDCVVCAISGGGCYGGCECDCENKVQIPTQFFGYSYFANSDGGYAVTEGIRQFLQAFSTQQLLFFDGDGYVETNPTVSVHAGEEGQWLFDCYYYKPKNN